MYGARVTLRRCLPAAAPHCQPAPRAAGPFRHPPHDRGSVLPLVPTSPALRTCIILPNDALMDRSGGTCYKQRAAGEGHQPGTFHSRERPRPGHAPSAIMASGPGRAFPSPGRAARAISSATAARLST
eukprot:scaffold276_cov548-Prasinococcus_capsulatus_cf.AAC.17